MSDILVTTDSIEEDTSPYLFARVVDGFGVVLTIPDVNPSGVTLRVFDLSGNDPKTAVATVSSLDPATTYNGHALMYNTLQTTGWRKDNIGYNFFHMPSIGILPTASAYGGRVLRWEYELSLSATLGGGKGWVVFETQIRPMRSS